jgi:hypothetical protein
VIFLMAAAPLIFLDSGIFMTSNNGRGDAFTIDLVVKLYFRQEGVCAGA